MSARENKKNNIDYLNFGKIPPQAKELESSILGAMINEPSLVFKVSEILKPSDFYVEAHQKICKIIFDIHGKNNIADVQLIVEELRTKDELDLVGGPFYIVRLTNNIANTANTEKFCQIIKQKSILRRLISFGSIILSNAYGNNADVFELLDEAESQLKGINFELEENKITHLGTVAMSVIEKFDKKVYNAQNGIEDGNTVYTGIEQWDRINGSLFHGLFIVAGRPGMGKGVHLTELACRMGQKYDIGIINGEMTDEQLLTRIGCNLLGIDNYLFKKDPKTVSETEQEKLHEAMEAAIQLKIHIENSRHINKIANRIKIWVEKYNVKCVLADFLTLFKVPYELEKYYTDKQRVDYVLDVFTQLCKDLKIPIILYVQMNREILGRSGIKEPNLADLKQSGSIEELAYQVSFLHRPEYYDESAITDEMGESTKGLCYQIIAKHRDGKLGRIKMRVDLPCSRMKSWNDISSFSYKQDEIINTPF